MFVITAFAVGLLLASTQSAQQSRPPVWKGIIQEVRGGDGLLIARPLKKGSKEQPRQFDIRKARFLGLDKAELKVGDLRPGDHVEMTLAPDGKTVQEVRVEKQAPPV